MDVSLKKQRFLNYMAKCGWYPISIEAGKKGVETRVYMTPRGNFMVVVMNEEEITQISRREDI